VTEPGPPPDSEVRDEDWGGRELLRQTYTRVAFIDVDLSEVVSEGAVFDECTFRGVRFNVSQHRSTAFLNCAFTRCSFFDTTFSGCKAVGSKFQACSFDLVKVDGGDWSFVGLRGADLGSACFVDVRMREADLSGVRAVNGVLTGVDLSGSDVSEADLTGCDLRGSDLSAIDPASVRLQGAVITGDQAVLLAFALGMDVRSE
jgi:fluoroquinolone resistance protein